MKIYRILPLSSREMPAPPDNHPYWDVPNYTPSDDIPHFEPSIAHIQRHFEPNVYAPVSPVLLSSSNTRLLTGIYDTSISLDDLKGTNRHFAVRLRWEHWSYVENGYTGDFRFNNPSLRVGPSSGGSGEGGWGGDSSTGSGTGSHPGLGSPGSGGGGTRPPESEQQDRYKTGYDNYTYYYLYLDIEDAPPSYFLTSEEVGVSLGRSHDCWIEEAPKKNMVLDADGNCYSHPLGAVITGYPNGTSSLNVIVDIPNFKTIFYRGKDFKGRPNANPYYKGDTGWIYE